MASDNRNRTYASSTNGAIELRINLKALRVRPAREPGDKPVLEMVLRTEVDGQTIAIAARAGKDMTCYLVPDPEMQPALFVEASAEDEAEEPEEPVAIPSNGRRRRGTRTSETVEA